MPFISEHQGFALETVTKFCGATSALAAENDLPISRDLTAVLTSLEQLSAAFRFNGYLPLTQINIKSYVL